MWLVTAGELLLRGYVCVIWNVRVNEPPFKDLRMADMKVLCRRLVVLRGKLMRCVVINCGLIVAEGVCMCNLECKSK